MNDYDRKRQDRVEEKLDFEHDRIEKIYHVLCENGVIAAVKSNGDRIEQLEDRHMREDAIDNAQTGNVSKQSKRKAALRDWMRIAVAVMIPTSIYLFDKFS